MIVYTHSMMEKKLVGEVFMFDLGLYIHLASKIKDINYAEMLMYYIIRNLDTYHLNDIKMLINSNLFESIKKINERSVWFYCIY